MKYNFLALILARSSSKDIPKRNIYNINVYHIISYSIEAAKNHKYFLVSRS
tara:strand:+ start:996 stop:1148 length:153 start_codon:yes stop_codon:yes gene_type:complete